MSKFDSLYIAAKEKLLAAKNIAMVTHINPDGDCTGAALAVRKLLLALGKDADIYNEQGFPSFMEFLRGDAVFNRYTQEDGVEYDLTVFIDCGNIDRAGKVAWVCEKSDFIINIDHHSTNPMFGDINIVDSTASASGLLIYDFFKACGVEITLEVANFLYVAIMMDTGNFSYSNTDKRTHDVAGDLLELGVDPSVLTQKILRSTTYNKLKLTAMAIDTLHMYCDGKIAVIHASKAMYNATGTDSSDSEGFVGMIRDIKGVGFAVFLRDTTDGKLVKVSIRSNLDVDVSKIAAEYNGGGHYSAAGCSIEGKIPDVEEIIVKRLSEEL